MAENIGPENPEYWSKLYETITPKDLPTVRDYMISEEGLRRFLNSKGPNIVRKADGTVVIEEGEQD